MTSANGAGAAVLTSDALAGQRVIVTGAGSGIGRAVAERLASLGADVHGIGRHGHALDKTAELTADAPGSFSAHTADVRKHDEVTALARRLGEEIGLTALVNNAGGQFAARAEEISMRGWNAVIDLNLSSVFNLCRAVHPYLREQGGTILNMSLSGVERGSMGLAHAIAARAGVLGLTRTLALEWAGDGIRLNCIGPGTVLTDGFLEHTPETVIADLVAAAPLGRATTVQEVAELVAFLLTPAGALITGQLLQVDGGAHLGPGLHMLGGSS